MSRESSKVTSRRRTDHSYVKFPVVSLGLSLALEAKEPVLFLLTSVASLKVEVLCGSNLSLVLQLWV